MLPVDYIAPYIFRSEYECPCCHSLPPDLEDICYEILFDHFETIRIKWGRSIPISSGYRCPEWNRKVGGVLNSVHMFGLALDLDCENIIKVDKLYTLINEYAPSLRVGVYKDNGSFIHIDVGYLIMPRLSNSWTKGKRWYG